MRLSDEHEAALARLVAAGELTAENADAVRREFSVVAPPRMGWLTEVAGYAGGGLMLVGAGLFLANAWEKLGQALQATVFGVTGALFVIAALVIAGREGVRKAHGAKGRAAGVLLALSPIAFAFAAGIAADKRDVAVGFVVGLVTSAVTLAVRSNAIGVLVAAVMTFGTVVYLNEYSRWTVTGMWLLAAGLLWIAVTSTGRIKPVELGLAAGAVLALVGAQSPLELGDNDPRRYWAYGLTLAVALGAVAYHRWRRSLAMLVAGVIGVTIAVPELVYDATDGGLSPAVIVLIAGVVLVASSIVALKLRKAPAE